MLGQVFTAKRLAAIALLPYDVPTIQSGLERIQFDRQTDGTNAGTKQAGVDNADNFTRGIHQRSAAIARIDRGIDLDEVLGLLVDETSNSAVRNFQRVSELVGKRKACDAYIVALFWCGRCHRQNVQVVRVDFQKRQIIGPVVFQNIGGIRVRSQHDLNRAGVFNHMSARY